MVMQPELPSPAPPPIQPPSVPRNSYDFITNPGVAPKKGILPTGGTKQSRILLVIGGFLGLIIIGMIIFAVINGLSSSQKEDWLTLAQKQTELIRITDIATAKAQLRDTKNLAATTKASLISSQKTVNSLAKKNGATISSKTLALGKDINTDKQLTSAEQTNQFDATFQVLLKKELGEYQVLVKKLYDSTGSKSTKASLNGIYNNANLLVQQSNQ